MTMLAYASLVAVPGLASGKFTWDDPRTCKGSVECPAEFPPMNQDVPCAIFWTEYDDSLGIDPMELGCGFRHCCEGYYIHETCHGPYTDVDGQDRCNTDFNGTSLMNKETPCYLFPEGCWPEVCCNGWTPPSRTCGNAVQCGTNLTPKNQDTECTELDGDCTMENCCQGADEWPTKTVVQVTGRRSALREWGKSTASENVTKAYCNAVEERGAEVTCEGNVAVTQLLQPQEKDGSEGRRLKASVESFAVTMVEFDVLSKTKLGSESKAVDIKSKLAKQMDISKVSIKVTTFTFMPDGETSTPDGGNPSTSTTTSTPDGDYGLRKSQPASSAPTSSLHVIATMLFFTLLGFH